MYINVPKGDFESVEQLGNHVADAGLDALRTSPVASEMDPFLATRFTVSLPIVFEIEEQEARRRRDQLDEIVSGLNPVGIPPFQTTVRRFLGELLDESIDLLANGLSARSIDAAVAVLGEIAIVMVPLEVAWQLGAEIRRSSPFPLTLIATTALSYGSYLTARKFYEVPREEMQYEAVGLTSTAGYIHAPSGPEAFAQAVLSKLNVVRNGQGMSRNTHETGSGERNSRDGL